MTEGLAGYSPWVAKELDRTATGILLEPLDSVTKKAKDLQLTRGVISQSGLRRYLRITTGGSDPVSWGCILMVFQRSDMIMGVKVTMATVNKISADWKIKMYNVRVGS